MNLRIAPLLRGAGRPTTSHIALTCSEHLRRWRSASCLINPQAERRKWEGCEERLLEQIREAGKQSGYDYAHASPMVATRMSTRMRGGSEETAGMTTRGLLDEGAVAPLGECARTSIEDSRMVSAVTTGAREREPTATHAALSSALLAQQLPLLSKFSGEELSEPGETFKDWIEQLETVASICLWDDRTKLKPGDEASSYDIT